ncbi:nuclear transport factor 2 family protein [Nocardia transvalensis]|uniref:nuclear transport factor 2 family protein n=1 Tax=Nocardia transvalensis TaxID=37333 RepID=UPI0018959E8E|nr:nuclear transport factor 2 family protein [Nocardia transvalensis]MBF6331147.1 nuclear transport factor 2 family protein [Nocardia transvalensis]
MSQKVGNPMPADTVTRFRQAFAAGDPETMIALLAPDFELHSPVEAHTYRGRDAAGIIFRALMETLTDYRHRGQLTGASWDAGPADTHIWLFRARIESLAAHGMMMIQLDDTDRVAALTVMIRPLPALIAFDERMRAEIEARNGGEPITPATRGM